MPRHDHPSMRICVPSCASVPQHAHLGLRLTLELLRRVMESSQGWMETSTENIKTWELGLIHCHARCLLLLQVPVEFRPGPTPWEKGGRRWVFLSLFNGVRAPHALSLAHMSPGPRDSAP